MADFLAALGKTIQNEGGFIVHLVPVDRGGMTYAGISRRTWPDWPGWALVDSGQCDSEAIKDLACDFFRRNFWDAINGDEIMPQSVAESIFDFSINVGVVTAVKLAQRVIGVADDGIIGQQSLTVLNYWQDPDKFIIRYALGKVAKYADICAHDARQKKFLLGWINRALAEVQI